MKTRNTRSAFTLVEGLIGVGILGILMAAAMSSISTASRSSQVLLESAEIRKDLRRFQDHFPKDARQAVSLSSAVPNSSITFLLFTSNAAKPYKSVKYFLHTDAVSQKVTLYRQDSDSSSSSTSFTWRSARRIVENVKAFSFTFYDKAGSSEVSASTPQNAYEVLITVTSSAKIVNRTAQEETRLRVVLRNRKYNKSAV